MIFLLCDTLCVIHLCLTEYGDFTDWSWIFLGVPLTGRCSTLLFRILSTFLDTGERVAH